jgi:hypothetical protein
MRGLQNVLWNLRPVIGVPGCCWPSPNTRPAREPCQLDFGDLDAPL